MPAPPSASPDLSPSSAPRRNSKAHRRRWLPYLGILLLATLITAGFWPQPIPVETAPVTVGILRATINEEGKTRVRQRYLVSAPIAGRLRRIPFQAGYAVRVGETVLAVIEPLTPTLLDERSRALAEAQRDAAEARRQKSLVAHDFAVSELKRWEKLFASNAISTQELETARWREADAAREKSLAEAALRQAEAELATFTPDPDSPVNPSAVVELRAPVNGQVLHVFEESARVVTPGTALMDLGDPNDLEVVIEVLSRDGALIPPGARVDLEQWGGEPLAARVRQVEPAAFTKISALGVEEQRVKVIADLVTPRELRAKLGDQFRVEAKITVWETDQALKVPTGALFRQGQNSAVFVLSGTRARLCPVKPGRASDTEVQIVEGLQEGQRVILYPGDRVKNGHRVKPIKI